MSPQEHARFQRFSDLPEETKAFLEGLTHEDLVAIREGINLSRAAKTVGRFWKWTAITGLALFAGLATFGQSAKWLWENTWGK